MKKLLLLTALICFLFPTDAFSHKKKKKRKKKKTTLTQKKKAASTKSKVFVVSFISMGAGIDYKKVPEFEKQLKDFNASNGCNITYEAKNWGREGEKDYCITSKDTICLNKYITTVKETINTNDRILLKENAICR